MQNEIVVEFVAGPRCGQVETLGIAGPMAPLSLSPAATADGANAVYLRRGDAPDPGSRRWLFDHAPRPNI